MSSMLPIHSFTKLVVWNEIFVQRKSNLRMFIHQSHTAAAIMSDNVDTGTYTSTSQSAYPMYEDTGSSSNFEQLNPAALVAAASAPPPLPSSSSSSLSSSSYHESTTASSSSSHPVLEASTLSIEILKQIIDINVVLPKMKSKHKNDMDIQNGRLFGQTIIYCRRKNPIAAIAALDRIREVAEKKKSSKIQEQENIEKDSVKLVMESIHLHCRDCAVKRVFINGKEINVAEMVTHDDYLFKICEDANTKDLRTFSASFAGSLEASEVLGELGIKIPKDMARVMHDRFLKRVHFEEEVIQLEKKRREKIKELQETYYNEDEGDDFFNNDNDQDARRLDELLSMDQTENDVFCIKIEYETIGKPGKMSGVVFVPPNTHPNSNGASTPAHVYTNTCFSGSSSVGGGCGSRCWLPCLDLLESKCPFEISITCEQGNRAIASGTLTKISNNPDGTNTFYFDHQYPISPNCVGFVVGPFVEIRKEMSESADGSGGQSQSLSWIHHYFLPGREELVQDAISGFDKIVQNIEMYLDAQYPFGMYSQVWIAGETCSNFALAYSTMAVLSDSLLVSEKYVFSSSTSPTTALIDDDFGSTMDSICAQATCFATAFFGSLISVRSFVDAWLALGLAGFLDNVIPRIHRNQSYHDKLHMYAKQCKRSFKRMIGTCIRRPQAGNVMSRALFPERVPIQIIDCALWSAKGVDIGSTLAHRAVYCIHQLEQRMEKPDGFKTLIHDYVVDAMSFIPPRSFRKDDQTLFLLKNESTSNDANSFAPFTHRRRDNLVDIRDIQESIRNVLQQRRLSLGNFESRWRRERSFSTCAAVNSSILNLRCMVTSTDTFLLDLTNRLDPDLSEKFGKDYFVDNWLRQTNIPKFIGDAQYSKRQHRVDSVLNQIMLPLFSLSKPTVASSLYRPYSASFKFQIVEEKGGSDQHKIVDRLEHKFSVPVSTPVSKQRAGRKTIDELNKIGEWNSIDSKSSKEIIDLYTQFAKRTNRPDIPVRYVLPDPYQELLIDLEWSMPDSMWVELLTRGETNGFIRLFAYRNMAKGLTWKKENERARVEEDDEAKTSSAGGQMRIGSLPTDYAGIRKSALTCLGALGSFARKPLKMMPADAVLAIADWQNYRKPARANHAGTDKDGHPETWAGKEMLVYLFKELFCAKLDNGEVVLQPNKFSQSREKEAFLKPAFVIALSKITAVDGHYPSEVKSIILDVLRNNDNQESDIDDGHYVAECVKAGARLCIGLKKALVDLGKNREGDERDAQETKSTLQSELEEVMGHIRRVLSYDAIDPSYEHIKTAACLEALSMIEPYGLIKPEHKVPYHAYIFGTGSRNYYPTNDQDKTIHISSRNWGRRVREAAFKAILNVHIVSRVVVGVEWMRSFDMLLHAASSDMCPLARKNMFNMLLGAYADVMNRDVFNREEIQQKPKVHESGPYWPLSRPITEIEKNELDFAIKICNYHWKLMNETFRYESKLRVLAHQLWRVIWGFETPGIYGENFARSNETLSLVPPFNRWDVDSDLYQEKITAKFEGRRFVSDQDMDEEANFSAVLPTSGARKRDRDTSVEQSRDDAVRQKHASSKNSSGFSSSNGN